MNTLKLLKIGEKLPEFECQDQYGNTIKHTDYTKNTENKKLIIFFYPRANTSGCTAEACNLSENYDSLQEKGYLVIGISADTVNAQKIFSDKNKLKFPLLADINKNIIDKFGVWGKKKLKDKEYEGIYRISFIFDQYLTLIKIITKVDTKNHTKQILELE